MLKKMIFAAAIVICCALALPAQEKDIFDLIKTGSVKQLKKHLAANPGDINATGADGRTPLGLAVVSGNNKAVKVLLNHGANPTQQYQIVGEFMRFGNPLLEAVWSMKNEEAIKIIVNNGFDINRPIIIDEQMDKALTKYLLFEVARYCSPDLLSFLIKKGADIHQLDQRGRTIIQANTLFPTSGSAESGADELEKLNILMRAGADLDSRGYNNITLLMKLVSIPTYTIGPRYKTNISKCVKFLVKAGVDLDRQDDDGWTALHCAVWFNNLEAVKILAKAGADPEIELKNGETPRDFAIKLKREGMAEILEEAEKN